MDQVLRSGKYDLKASSEAEVAFVEIKNINCADKTVEWELISSCTLPKNQLYYNDTSDAAGKYINSWKKFYTSGKDFIPELAPYLGGSLQMARGRISFGGLAKAAIYLRFSNGFIKWLMDIDPSAATLIQKKEEAFKSILTKDKLPPIWHKFKQKTDWTLPAITRLSDGTLLVLGLKNTDKSTLDSLEKAGINIKRSLELMSMLRSPEISKKGVIDERLQAGSGNGRNAFNREYKSDKLDTIPDSEFIRLLGYIPSSSRDEVLEVGANRLTYRVKTAPNPDTSELLFFPRGELKYSELKEWVDYENERRSRSFEEKKKSKLRASGDIEDVILQRPNILIAHPEATVFLINTEGAQKKKIIVQQIFPAVSLDYLAKVNDELLHSNTMWSVVSYMKAAISCQDADTPSVYQYWTSILTSLLQANYVSGNEVYLCFQRYCKAYSGDELIAGSGPHGKCMAREYFKVVGKLLRLQHIIHTARTEPERINTLEFHSELEAIQDGRNIKKGIFGMANENPSPQELVGDVYNSLRPKEKEKINAFIDQSLHGIPGGDFSTFIKGALVGMLLNELSWAVNNEGRRFSVTQGRHPSTLRGEQIESLFGKGVGLLINLDKQHIFNCQTLPFVKSCIAESRKDAFNSGLIMGLVFIHKSEDKSKEDK